MTLTCPVTLCDPLHPDTPGVELLPVTGKANTWRLRHRQTGEALGLVQQAAGAYPVEIYNGKGGLVAIITSPNGLKYFGLSGCKMSVGGSVVELSGEIITSGVTTPARTSQPIQPQASSPQATILGAGLATRFEPVSGENTGYSKPAVPLLGEQSVIECIANQLADHGFNRLIVNTFFKRESLKACLSRTKTETVLYIDENAPSGTAGGLRKMLLAPAYQGFLDESQPLLVVQGDAVTDADFSVLMEAHQTQKALVTIGCQTIPEEDVEKFGLIVTDQSGADGQSGRITGFQEKPPRAEAISQLANTGFYIFSPEAYSIIREIYAGLQKQNPEKPEPPLDFAMDIFPEILKRTQGSVSQGVFWAQQVTGYWSDIGNPRQYLQSVHDLYAGRLNLPLPPEADQYYREGVVFWPGAFALAQQDKGMLSGNVIVAKPFS